MAASAASASSTRTPSVSSISSRLASKPVSFRTCMTLATKSRCRNWIGDTFTAMRRPGQRWPVAAGPPQHPLAERDDEAELLGDGDEPRRADEALLGMRPAHQRLEPDDGQAVGREDRLVMEAEPVLVDRLAQVLLDRLTHADGLVHLPREEAVAVPALAFRLIEGGVG